MTTTFIDEKQQGKWQRKHAASLRHAYCKTRYFSHIEEIINLIEKSSHSLLVDLNISVIGKICQMLDIQTKMVRSSDVPTGNLDRSNSLIALCRHVNCTHYVSPPGAKQHLQEDNFAKLSDRCYYPSGY
jgi:bifunctional ADP-heptose synthase (sugar kinase/adenylyltransferase)